MVDAVRGTGVDPGAAREVARGIVRPATPGDPFGAVLERNAGTVGSVAFSGHAVRRMEQRGVQLDDAHMRRLQSAVDQAAAKGSRDSLILMDDLALVVSIKNRTVVTAVDQANQKEHVFTNVDSVVIAP